MCLVGGKRVRFRICIFGVIALAASLLTPGRSAHAENGCPIGLQPMKVPVESQSDCAAIPGYWDSAPPKQQVEPEPEWASRWGAISVGRSVSGTGMGASTNMKSEQDAKDAALRQCFDNNGGELCRSKIFSYQDQCVAMAWGNAYFAIWSAATIKIAAETAMRNCSKKTEDCQIYYSDCSYPVRIN